MLGIMDACTETLNIMLTPGVDETHGYDRDTFGRVRTVPWRYVNPNDEFERAASIVATDDNGIFIAAFTTNKCLVLYNVTRGANTGLLGAQKVTHTLIPATALKGIDKDVPDSLQMITSQAHTTPLVILQNNGHRYCSVGSLGREYQLWSTDRQCRRQQQPNDLLSSHNPPDTIVVTNDFAHETANGETYDVQVTQFHPPNDRRGYSWVYELGQSVLPTCSTIYADTVHVVLATSTYGENGEHRGIRLKIATVDVADIRETAEFHDINHYTLKETPTKDSVQEKFRLAGVFTVRDGIYGLYTEHSAVAPEIHLHALNMEQGSMQFVLRMPMEVELDRLHVSCGVARGDHTLVYPCASDSKMLKVIVFEKERFWRIERLLWIAHYKNQYKDQESNKVCILAGIAKDLIKPVVLFLKPRILH